MSTLTGIDKISRSASIFVDVENFQMCEDNFIAQNTLNVEYKQNSNYVSGINNSVFASKSYRNVLKTLTNPDSGKVNLNFSYIFVNDQNSSQLGTSNSIGKKSIVVKNGISQSYTKNINNSNNKGIAFINVLTNNSEFVNTLDLDSKVQAKAVAVRATSASAHIPVVIDLNDEWN